MQQAMKQAYEEGGTLKSVARLFGLPVRHTRWHLKQIGTVISRDARSREERFRAFMGPPTTSGCIQWLGATQRVYGAFSWATGETEGAHRAAYRLFKNQIPHGLLVRHSCDNPLCVNPDHLMLGTKQDNAQDAVDRKRTARGSKAGLAKLTEAKVKRLRKMYDQGATQTALAEKFGVSQAAVSTIVRHQTWKHI